MEPLPFKQAFVYVDMCVYIYGQMSVFMIFRHCWKVVFWNILPLKSSRSASRKCFLLVVAS